MTTLDLQTKYTSPQGSVFMTGVQALVRVLFDQMRLDRAAGLRTAVFASGYPGSPLGGFDRELAAQHELFSDHRVVHVPGHNEELAATSVLGTQVASTFPDFTLDGVLGVWYGKAPGLDRAGDAIRHAQFSGTSRHGGALAFVGDDPSCKSSTLPSSSEMTLQALDLPVLHPGSVQEVLDLGLHGVALSRASGLWSALRVVTAVADGTSTAEVGLDRVVPRLPEVTWRGQPFRPTVAATWVGATPSAELEQELYEARLEAARAYGALNDLNRTTVDPPDARLGLVATGYAYHELMAALAKLGLGPAELADHGVRVLQVRLLHPLDPGTLRRFARGLHEVFVVEEKRPLLETALRDALYGQPDQPTVVGKLDEEGRPLLPRAGTLDVDALVGPVAKRLARYVPAERLRPQPRPRTPLPMLSTNRTPYFCSGCPHNASTQVPEGTVVGAGIGCHGIVQVMDPDRVGAIRSTTQMGGEGAQWIGIEPFVDLGHMVQNIGDGTYFHSGQLAVQAAVSAKSNITYKLLYNSAIAMTGGQDTAYSNARPVPDVAGILVRQGVSRVLITTDDPGRYKGVALPRGVEVWDRGRLIEAQEALAATAGVTVLLHDQQCATEKRRARKRGRIPAARQRIFINERVCEGCGDCGAKSNCLAVEPVDTPFGRKTAINQSACNEDLSCLAGDCPSFVSVVERPRGAISRLVGRRNRDAGAGGGASARRRPALPAPLPEPELRVDADDVTVRMPGIGGTGVVTVNQILGTAALVDGRHVAGLDQTGLSQKAGPVVSDLRITTRETDGSNKPSTGSVDVYIVFDLLVALSPTNLQALSPERTVAVVSTSRTATGSMIVDVDVAYPDESWMLATLSESVRPGGLVTVDALGATQRLFGDTATANVFSLGVAYQAGYLPVSAAAIESAIELNGVAVETNKLAFGWGRQWVEDPDVVRAAFVERPPVAPAVDEQARRLADGLDLEATERAAVELRVADLLGYQGERWAQRFLDTVASARAAEQRVAPGSTAFTTAVATGLHKLMAYKDEYEVARLHLDAAARVDASAHGGGRVYWHLQPPFLKALGLQRKVRLGPWATPLLVALRAGRRVRGTPFDVFGYSRMRRLERGLIAEYEGVVRDLTDRLGTVPLDRAVEVAQLPDLVRGYEALKLANVDRYHAELGRLLETAEAR